MDDIKSVEQDRLWKIECANKLKPAYGWMPVTIGEGVVVSAESKDIAEGIIKTFIKEHEDKGVPEGKIPLFRARLMSVEETIEVRKHIERRGQVDGGIFGTNIGIRKVPKLGETYHF